jgi:hypothetical protein
MNTIPVCDRQILVETERKLSVDAPMVKFWGIISDGTWNCLRAADALMRKGAFQAVVNCCCRF